MDTRISDNLTLGLQILTAHRIGMYYCLIFAMRGNQAWRLLEQTHQDIVLIHKHVAGATAHEQLDATNLFRICLDYLIKVVVSGAKIKRIVSQ